MRSRAAPQHEVAIERDLYLAGSDDILERVRAVDPAHRGVLVVAHTSSIRGLAREIEGLSGEDAANFRIATALPLIYTPDAELRLTDKQELTAGWSSRVRKFLNKHKPGTRISWV